MIRRWSFWVSAKRALFCLGTGQRKHRICGLLWSEAMPREASKSRRRPTNPKSGGQIV